jgi:hypothetical protein
MIIRVLQVCYNEINRQCLEGVFGYTHMHAKRREISREHTSIMVGLEGKSGTEGSSMHLWSVCCLLLSDAV